MENFDFNIDNSKVLIVDDHPQNISLLGTFLSKFKFKIAVATNGQIAYDTAIKFLPDLILMDINMPVLDGFEATRLIKNNELTKHIPVIFTTALAETNNIIQGFQLGGVDYITKPFQLEELYQRVKTHLILQKSLKIITETNELLDQMNRSKDKFFSIISHDLRGPYTASLNLTELLLSNSDKFTKEQLVEIVSKINSSLITQFSLLEKLLDWSRLQTGRIEFKPLELDMVGIVNNLLNIHRQSCDNKSIKLDTVLPSKLICVVDEFMISSALGNIISNAIKFTPENGSILIKLQENNNNCSITITDSGIGMNQEILDNLFKIDSNQSRTGTNKEKGTGLGLILSKEFIEKNKGTINITSKVGEGSTFEIVLPIGI